jgi:FkbM family methyltransferase
MIKYFELTELRKRITSRLVAEGYSPTAFGGLRGNHFSSVVHATAAATVHKSLKPCINESAFEVNVLLSVLQQLPDPNMVFVEAGAGWGSQSLTITSAVKNQVVDMKVKNTLTFAVEAEPGHYQFLCETFLMNGIKGAPLFGALSDSIGWPSFYAQKPSADNYGQSLQSGGNINVPCFTVEYLVDTFKIDQIDLIHMDVQGEESKVIRGALPVIKKINYLLVCPHHGPCINEITELLSPTHTCLLSLPARSGYHDIPGFPLPVHLPQDGMMLWERRES